jgi:hypothetical protein
MSAMICADVQEQLDFLAAGVCDPATRAALEQHLHACPECAGRFAESQRLLGMLDLHWNQAAMACLRQRIEQQARPRRRLITPFLHGYVAAAAMLLIAVGLLSWATLSTSTAPQLALLVNTERRQTIVLDAHANARAVAPGAEALAMPAPAARNDNSKPQRGALPPPPVIDLDLTLVNTGQRPITVRIGEVVPVLSLDVLGEGLERIAASPARTPSFLQSRTLRLDAGQSHVIHINRLIAGSPAALEYVYLTKPGVYAVSARLRVLADGMPVTVTGGPVRITVEGKR